MRNVSFAPLFSTEAALATAAPVVAPAAPAAPVANVTTTATKPGAKRTVRTTKPATTVAKPAAATKPVAAKPAKPEAKAVSAPATPSRDITRTAATIAADRTNFGGTLSDRDNAYLSFYAKLAKRAKAGRVTIADIVASASKPNYNGSNKPHDAGVINRLAKAGLLDRASDGTSFTFTAKAKSLKQYAAA